MALDFSLLRPDPEQATPLYRQLAQRLVARIEAGDWHAGEALPSERVLAERLGVSRITARRALDRLIEQGLVRRSPGSGTFVAPRLTPSLNRLSSFTEQLVQRGYHPGSQWLERHLSRPTAEECLRLGLDADSEVVHLVRQRLADEVVVAVEKSCLPLTVMSDPRAVEGSLYRHLQSLGTPVVRALQQVSAVSADAELARLTEVVPGTALLRLTRLGYLGDGRAAELTVSWCRTDYYDFVVELVSAGG